MDVSIIVIAWNVKDYLHNCYKDSLSKTKILLIEYMNTVNSYSKKLKKLKNDEYRYLIKRKCDCKKGILLFSGTERACHEKFSKLNRSGELDRYSNYNFYVTDKI